MRLVRLFVLCSLIASLFPVPRAALAASPLPSSAPWQVSPAQPALPESPIPAGAERTPDGIRFPSQTRPAAGTLSRESFEEEFSLRPPPASGLHVEQDAEPLVILRQDLAPAATPVCSGTSLNITSSVQWTTAGSPYSVNCQINISTGGVLDIAPGVVVQFGGNGRIVASNGGAFRAIGDASRPISLTSELAAPVQGAWGGVQLDGASSGANHELRYVTIQWAGQNNQPSLKLSNDNQFANHPILDHVTVLKGMAAGIELNRSRPSIMQAIVSNGNLGPGLSLIDSSPEINGLELRSNEAEAMSLDANSRPAFNDVTIQGNSRQQITYQAGSLATAWTMPNLGVPYAVKGSITLNSAESLLTVDAGVVLLFETNGELIATNGGTLVVNGQANKPVLFSAFGEKPQRGQWKGVTLFGTGGAGRHTLSHLIVEYAGAGNADALLLRQVPSDETRPTLDNVTTRFNRAAGIHLLGSNVPLRNIASRFNGGFGLWLQQSSPTINGLQVRDNGGEAVHLESNSAPAWSTVEIAGNRLNQIGLDAGSGFDGAWRVQNLAVPYVVTGTVDIGTEETLEVDAGVEMRFNQDGNISTFSGGVLRLNGTEAQPIILTANSKTLAPGQWRGLNLGGRDVSHVLRFTTVEYAGRGNLPAVKFTGMNANPVLDHVTVQLNLVDGIDSTDAALTIKDSSILQNGGTGLRLVGSKAVIDGLEIRENGGEAINLDYRSNPDWKRVTIAGNRLEQIGLQAQNSTMSGAWTMTNWGVPYVVTDTLWLGSGSVLNVEAGVKVRFSPTGQIRNSSGGVLKAVGVTPEADDVDTPIIFTAHSASPTPGFWKGLLLSGPGHQLRNIVVEYAGKDSQPAVSILNSQTVPLPNLEDVTISKSGDAGLALSSSNATLKHVTVADNGGAGLLLEGSSPAITGLRSERNRGEAIRLDFDSQPSLSDIVISGNSANQIGYQAGALRASWTMPNLGVPYVMTGTLTMFTGENLTVAAGTTVRFAKGAQIRAAGGGLDVQGTVEAPVRFTAHTQAVTPGWWSGLELNSVPDNSGSVLQLRNLRVEYAGTAGATAKPAILLTGDFSRDVHPLLENVSVRFSGGDGIAVEDSRATIRDSEVRNSLGSAVNVYRSAPVLERLRAANNTRHNAVVFNRDTQIYAQRWYDVGLPIRIEGTYNLSWNDATQKVLEIGPGTVIVFANRPDGNQEKGGINVGASGTSLTIAGEVSNPARLTSTNAQPKPGEWRGINVTGGAIRVTGAIIEGAETALDLRVFRSFGNTSSHEIKKSILQFNTRAVNVEDNDEVDIWDTNIRNNGTGLQTGPRPNRAGITNSNLFNNTVNIFFNNETAPNKAASCGGIRHSFVSPVISTTECFIVEDRQATPRPIVGPTLTATGPQLLPGKQVDLKGENFNCIGECVATLFWETEDGTKLAEPEFANISSFLAEDVTIPADTTLGEHRIVVIIKKKGSDELVSRFNGSITLAESGDPKLISYPELVKPGEPITVTWSLEDLVSEQWIVWDTTSYTDTTKYTKTSTKLAESSDGQYTLAFNAPAKAENIPQVFLRVYIKRNGVAMYSKEIVVTISDQQREIIDKVAVYYDTRTEVSGQPNVFDLKGNLRLGPVSSDAPTFNLKQVLGQQPNIRVNKNTNTFSGDGRLAYATGYGGDFYAGDFQGAGSDGLIKPGTAGNALLNQISGLVVITKTLTLNPNILTGKVQGSGNFNLTLPENPAQLWKFSFTIDSTDNVSGKTDPLTLKVVGATLKLGEGTLDRDGVAIASADLTFGAELGAGTVKVNDLLINKEGIRIGDGTFTLPPIKFGPDANQQIRILNAAGRFSVDRGNFNLVATGALSITIPENVQEVPIEFAVTRQDGKAALRGYLPELTLKVAGTTLKLNDLALHNDGLDAVKATLTLPEELRNNLGDKGTVEFTGVKIRKNGILIDRAQGQFPIPETKLGQVLTITNGIATLVGENQQLKLRVEADLHITLPDGPSVAKVVLVFAANSDGETTISGNLKVDQLPLTVAGISLLASGVAISNNGVSATTVDISLPAEWGQAKARVNGLQIDARTGLTIAGGTAEFRLPRIDLGAYYDLDCPEATCPNAATGPLGRLTLEGKQFKFVLNGMLHIQLPDNNRRVPVSFSVMVGADGKPHISGSLQALQLQVVGGTLDLTTLTVSDLSVHADSAQLRLPEFGSLSATVTDITISRDGLRIGAADASFKVPNITLGDVVRIEDLKGRLSAENQVFKITASGTVLVDWQGVEYASTGSATLTRGSDGKTAISGTMDNLSFKIAGGALTAQNLTVNRDGLFVQQATFKLATELGGAEGFVTDVRVHRTNGLSIGGGQVGFDIKPIKFSSGENKFEATNLKARIVINPDGVRGVGITASGDIAIDIPQNQIRARITITVDPKAGFSGSVEGQNGEDLVITIVGEIEIAVRKATLDKNGLTLDNASLTLPESLGGGTASVTRLNISREGQLSIAGGKFRMPDMKVGGEAGFTLTGLWGEVKEVAIKLPDGGTTKGYEISGGGGFIIPIGAELTVSFAITNIPEEGLALKRACLGIKSTTGVGVPLGTTGLYLTGVDICADFSPTKFQIKGGVTISTGPTGAVAGTPAVSGKVSMTIDSQPLTYSLSGALYLYAWKVGQAGFRVNARGFEGYFEFLLVFVRGRAEISAWYLDGLHVAGKASVEILIPAGIIPILGPPDDIIFAGIYIEFGEFRTPKGGVVIGIKGEVEILGKDLTGFVSAKGDLAVGEGAKAYVLATPPPDIFPPEGITSLRDSGRVTINQDGTRTDKVQEFTLSEPQDLLASIRYTDTLATLNLIDPNGRRITPDTAAADVQAMKSAHGQMIGVEQAMPGKWSIEVVTDQNARERYIVGVIGPRSSPVLDNVVVQPGNPSTTITWDATEPNKQPNGDGGVGVTLMATTSPTGTEGMQIGSNVEGGTFTWDTRTVPNGKYYVYLRADDGMSPFVGFTSPTEVVVNNPILASPAITAAVASGGRIALTWQPISAPNVSRYEVLAGPDKDQLEFSYNVSALPGEDGLLHYDVPAPPQANTWTVTVRGVDTSDRPGASAFPKVVVMGDLVPAAVAPAARSVEVPVTTTVDIVFNRTIDGDSVGGVLQVESATGLVAGTVVPLAAGPESDEAIGIRWTATRPLTAGRTYTATLFGDVRGARTPDGLLQRGDQVWTFTTVTPAAELPDLRITNLQSTPAGSGAYTITATVQNNGLGNADLTEIVLRKGDQEVARSAVGPIVPSGGQETVSWRWQPAEAGLQTLDAVVDPDNTIGEVVENNNSRSVQVTVVDLRPDLTVTALTATATGTGAYTIKATVQNAGGVDVATAIAVRLTDGQTVLQNGSIASLAKGSSATVEWNYQPAGAGDHILQAAVDPDGLIAEADESNNTRTVTVTVAGAQQPDLTIGTLTATQNADGSFTLRGTVRNTGAANVTTAIIVRLMEGATVVGEVSIAALASNASADVELIYRPTTAGTHTLTAVVNPGRTIDEVSFDNNISPPVEVTVETPPRQNVYLPLITR